MSRFTIIAGGQSGVPRHSLRRSPRQAARPAWESLLEREWRRIFDRLRVHVSTPPFLCPEPLRTLWLPASRQVVLLASDLARPTLRHADALDSLVGPRPFVDELDEDQRVVLALRGGRFFGLRGGSLAVHSALALYRCASCRRWWFLAEWGSWRCQCCGSYDGNAGIVEQFADVIALPATRRAIS